MSLQIRITENESGRTIEIGEPPRPHVVSLGAISLGDLFGPRTGGQVNGPESPKGPQKLDAKFQPLPDDATGAEWVYTHDRTTNLVWTRGEIKVSNWADAKAKAEAAGEGFRMPTIQERLSLVKYDAHEPAIDTAFYDSPTSDWSWTSTPANWNAASAAWSVGLGYGAAGTLDRDGNGFVRAVRSGVPSSE